MAALVVGWMVREEARELLKEIADIERIVGRVNLGLASRATCGPSDSRCSPYPVWSM